MTSSPLVPDGITQNYPQLYSLQSTLQSAGPEMPVPVTLTVGSPTVVSINTTAIGGPADNTHFFKPNQSFYFIVSAGGSLPTGVSANTPYYITAANLTATSFTFSAVNNFNTTTSEGAAVNSSGSVSGTVSIVLTGRDLNIFIPPGPYFTGNYGDSNLNVAVTPNGISRIRYWAYGAIFDTKVSFGPNAFAAFTNVAWARGTYSLIKTTGNYNNTILLDGVVTPINTADAANFYVGQWITIFGVDIQDPLGTVTSGPPNNQFQEFKRIKSINLSTGAITVDGPLKWVYLSTFPNLANGNPAGTIGGGAAMISPMNPIWDTEVEVRGARWVAEPAESSCRRMGWIDCVFRGFGFSSSQGAPSMTSIAYYKSCRFGPTVGGPPFQYMEVDKMLEHLELDDCWIPSRYYILFTSVSLQVCILKKVIGSQIWGTPRNIEISASIFDAIQVGAWVGQTDSAQIISTRSTFFAVNNRPDDTNSTSLGPNNDMNLLANWTFSNGTFTRNITGLPGNQGMTWQVPGTKVFFVDASQASPGTPTWNVNMGGSFMITDVELDGSGNFSFGTTLAAVPTRQTSAAVTITIASPGVFTGPTLTAGAPVVFTTTGALPTGILKSVVYWVVNPSGGTFQVASTQGGAAINLSGTQSGVHTVWVNPLRFRPHPCPRFTGIGNSGHMTLTDMNGAVDEPMFSRAKRLIFGRQNNTSQTLQQPNIFLWGNLISMTITVLKAASSGTMTVTSNGFVQPTALTNSAFSQTIDMTQVGKRVITSTSATGNLGTDALTAYPDWLGGPMWFVFTGAPNTHINSALIMFEAYTDQGIARFNNAFGMPAGPAGVNFTWMLQDAGIQAQFGTSP